MSADPITIDGEFYADNIDPMLAAIRQALVDADASDATKPLHEFGELQVVVVPPDETEAGINAKISTAIGKTKGLCLLLVAGGGKNPDVTCPGPRMTLTLEAQLYVSSRIRGQKARPVLELLGAIMKLYHQAEIRISGFPWFEQIRVTGFDPMPDPDFTAYVITMEREFQL